MTKRQYVTKLLYKTFLYQVNLEFTYPRADRADSDSVNAARLAELRDWLKANCKHTFKTRVSWSLKKINKQFVDHCQFNIYIADQHDYDLIASTYQQSVKELKYPQTDEVADLIRQGVEIDYRTHLYFHLYKHKAYIKNRWTHPKEIQSTINDALYDPSLPKQNYRLMRSDIVYLNDNELVLIKLILGDKIYKVTTAIVTDFTDSAIPIEFSVMSQFPDD
jgi:hypothetical protein